MSTITKTNPVSDRVNSMEESATLAMAQKARELAASGANVINLSVGEPDFTTPSYINDAAKKALDEGFTFYTPVPGIPELKKAIAEKLTRENGIVCGPDNIVVSTGAKQSLMNTILALVNPGDEVIILAPYWVSYVEMVKFAEGNPVIVSGTIENDFEPSIEDIKKAITPKTRAILYSSPSNPSGAMLSKGFFEQLADVVIAHENLFVIADEIYEYINYAGGHESLGAIERVRDRVITVNGFSKGFAMTGWRVGYIAAPVWLAKATNKIQGQVTSGTCSIAQKACVEALVNREQLEKTTKEMCAAYLRRRDLIVSLLSKVPGVKVNTPKGAFYSFPDMSAHFGKTAPNGTKIANSDDLSMYFLADAHVSTVSGAAFGAPANIRLSFATADDKIVEAIARIEKSLAKLA